MTVFKWFKPVPDNIEDLKSAFRKLAMKWHPDRGGNNETMREINAEYASLFDKVKDTHRSTRADGPRTYEAKEKTKETPQDFINIVMELFKLDGLDVELCGRWLWIGGNTLAHKKRLRELGCSWSKNKQKWSWHFPEDAAVSYAGRKAWSMDRIRSQFGSEVLRRDSETQQAAGMRSTIGA